jgi:iron complex transport system ATP-binding protein
MIQVRNLSITTSGDQGILNELSLRLAPGQVLGIYGPNGSGKSSALKAISGIRLGHEIKGEIQFEGVPLELLQNPKERVKRVLYLGSDFYSAFDLSVRELFELGLQAGGISSRSPMSEVVEVLGIVNFLSRDFRTLSDGEKQFMMFARALIQAPKVLILDETFSKLDLDRLIQVTRIIRKWKARGMSFLITSHDLNFLSEISDELMFLKSGKVLAHGPVNEMLTPARLKDLYPDVSLQVVTSPETGRWKILY